MSKKANMIIFASGNGSNAENIVNWFANHSQIEVKEILSSKVNAFVHDRARRLGIPSSTITKEQFRHVSFMKRLKDVDYIILAGFFWLIPSYLVKIFPNRIINIHPSLLPKYGGKGMYGSHIHEAVIKGGEKESGITIHLVNEEYDKGKILFQAKCEVDKADTVDSLVKKIHSLEHAHFPRVIEELVFDR